MHFIEWENVEKSSLCQEMFRARASQFVNRLGWKLNVDINGRETDLFDDPDAHYVIVSDENGRHAGSARLRSTLKPTLVNNVFLHLLDDVPINASGVWECSRFCLSEGAESRFAVKLLHAIAVFALQKDARSIVGVYDKRMERVYRRYSIPPTTICSPQSNIDGIGIGAWSFCERRAATFSKLVETSSDTCPHRETQFNSASGLVA